MRTGKRRVFSVMRAAPELAMRSFAQHHGAFATRADGFDKVATAIFTHAKAALGFQAAAAPLTSPLRVIAEWILVAAKKAAVLTISRHHPAGFASWTGNIGDLFLKAGPGKFVDRNGIVAVD
jgi:hypothetical protein